MKDQPPIFRSWRNLYAFVVIWLAVQVVLFHLFTKAFK